MKTDINFAQCLKSIEDIGSTTWQNVCDGTQTVVPWGSSTWVSFGFVVLLVGGFLLGVTGMLLFVLYEYLSRRISWWRYVRKERAERKEQVE